MNSTYRCFSENFNEKELIKAASELQEAFKCCENIPVVEEGIFFENKFDTENKLQSLCRSTTYGIIVYDETGEAVCRYCDLSFDGSSVCDLAERLNREEVEIVHLGEIIEDFLAAGGKMTP